MSSRFIQKIVTATALVTLCSGVAFGQSIELEVDPNNDGQLYPGGCFGVAVNFVAGGSATSPSYRIQYDPAVVSISSAEASACSSTPTIAHPIFCNDGTAGAAAGKRTVSVIYSSTIPVTNVPNHVLGPLEFCVNPDLVGPFPKTTAFEFVNVSSSIPTSTNDSANITSTPAPDISVAPSPGQFTAALGATADVDFTVTNSGTASGLLVNNVTVSPSGIFSYVSETTTCPNTAPGLAQGATCTVTVRFTPGGLGEVTGSLLIDSNAGTESVTLNGTGTPGPAGALSITPSPFNFGVLLTNDESLTQAFTITNTGADGSSIDTLTFTGLGGQFNSVVSDSNTCGTLAPLEKDESCTYLVKFTPTANGATTATLTVSGVDGNGGTKTASSVLSGTGVTEARPTSNPAPGKQTENLTGTDTEHTFNVVFGNTGNESYVYDCDLNTTTTGVFTISNNENVTVAAEGTQTMAVACEASISGTYTASAACTVDGEDATYQFECVVVRPLLGVEDTDHDFATEVDKVSPAHSFELCNAGNADGLTFTLPFVLSGVDAANFNVTSTDCPASGTGLAEDACCTVDVTFAPDEVREGYQAALAIVSSHGSEDITLGGEGTAGPAGNLTITPASTADFGEVLSNKGTATKTFTVTSDGDDGSVVTLEADALLRDPRNGTPSPFSITSSTCTNEKALAKGQTCSVVVTFEPTADGDFDRNLFVSGVDVNGDTREANADMTGKGVSRAIPSSNPASGASLTETVGPEGSFGFEVLFGNAGNTAYNVACDLTQGDEEVWTITGDDVSVAEDGSRTVTATCALPDTETYAATMSCDVGGQTPFTYNVECVGLPPLPVPVDNKWALALLALMMLMAASLGYRFVIRQ